MIFMEMNLPQSLDLSNLPPQAAKAVFSYYESVQKRHAKPQLTKEERLKMLDEWVLSHADVKVVLADDSRESLYD